MSTELKEKTWKVVLTSDCTCTNEDETMSDDCFGCWDDSKELFNEALAEWRKEVGVTWDTVRIEGTGMGWQRSYGVTVVPFNKALDALTLRGDFRITATWDEKTFTATRASHDEPTGGAKFTFTLIKDEEEEG